MRTDQNFLNGILIIGKKNEVRIFHLLFFYLKEKSKWIKIKKSSFIYLLGDKSSVD